MPDRVESKVALAIAAAVLLGGVARCGGDGSERSSELARLRLTDQRPGVVETACRRAASMSTARVRCPSVVPSGRTKVGFVCPMRGCASKRRDSYGIDLASGDVFHWSVAAGPPRTVCLSIVNVPRRTDPCLPRQARGWRIERGRLGAAPATLYRVPPYERGGGYHGGHVVVMWEDGRLARAVSLHGYGNRRRALAIARAMVDAP